MGFAARHEPIGRTIALPVPMRIEDVALRPLEAYPELPPTFHCSPLRADISVSACKSNFLSGSRVSCRGCVVGVLNAGVSERTAIDIINNKRADSHERAAAKGSLSCIRCLKSGMTNKRLIGKMRLVRNTVCVSCFNREREFVNGGVNSKGMPIRKWAGLRNATITVKTADGKRKIEDISLCMDAFECGRFVERTMPGATLVKTIIGDEVIEQFSLWTPPPFSPWEPGMVRDEKPSKPKRTYTHRGTRRTGKKTSTVASPVDWDTPLYVKPAPSDESDSDGSRQARRCGWLPPMDEEDDAGYRASLNEPALDSDSIAAFWDFTADGLAEFVEWLTDGWPVPVIEVGSEAKPSLSGLAKAHSISATLAHYRLRTRGTVEFPLDPNGSVLHTRNTSGINGVHWVVKRNKWCARGYQAGRAVHLGHFDTIEDATAARASFDSKPTEPSTLAADAIALPEVVEHAASDSEQPEQESEWAGCYLVRDGVTTYVCDYAKERGISDEEAAIVLGMCDPEYTDEEDDPQVIDSTAKLKSKPCAKRTNEPPKKLTGKQQRKLEKAPRRASTAPQRIPQAQSGPIAQTAHAYMGVLFGMAHAQINPPPHRDSP
ncbi:hypothetical protein M0D68_06880 [Paraburkholderia sp. SEWSISQ10-3 4]|uniref:hypothetical protein n=1 Tax=Paraburkholderia TaxID=1822464 RepID=UPI0022596E24|nr:MULTISPECIES: hypothetical protein [Paraburkholderia]MCX4137901.1 hypothetical protein [Paraburkholderia aspalathi]MDN7170592.1 hypothetical protein [Paraburkholderia sp. SEWSISQ10-3 4]MDQ6500231.1 hypothetical protein [Paraburkholderia aspalathi]